MVRADLERWQRWLKGEPVPFDAPFADAIQVKR